MNEGWFTAFDTFGLLIFTWFLLGVISTLTYHYGKRDRDKLKVNPSDMIPSSILGLLALILGFTFSLVVQRYESRRALAVKEANAISTAYMRGTLLHPVDGVSLKKYYQDYLKNRILFYESLGKPEHQRIARVGVKLKQQIWAHLQQVVQEERSAIPSAYIYALTDMFSVEDERTFALHRNLPVTLYFLIMLLSAVTIGSFYFDRGYNGETVHWRPLLLIFVFGIMIAFIHDMDHPTTGLITITQEAMINIREIMN